jgi:predicted ribonuclease YlaK
MNTKEYITYVLDTTVIAYDSDIIYRLFASDIFIPHQVMLELDGLKRGSNLAAENAREFIGNLDILCSYQDISQGITNSAGNRIFITTEYDEINPHASNSDNQIVGAALQLKNLGRHVILLSNNKNMRSAARSMGIKSDTFPFGMDSTAPEGSSTLSRKVI